MALLCNALLFPAGCQKKQEAFVPPPPKVLVAQPIREDVVDYLELSGNTQAVNTVQLRARVEGYLAGVYFKDGEAVKKDRLLFLIQQDTYFAQLMQADGAVQNQKALLDHATTEYARYTRLYQQKAGSEVDVENWRAQRDTAQAGLVTAQAQRDLAKLNLGYTWVVAPFTGLMDRRLVDPGNLVGSAGSNTILAELTQIDPLYVYFNISETSIPPYVQDARTATLRTSGSRQTGDAFPVHMGLANEEGYPHEGHLDFSSSSVNSSTGTLLLRAVFPNPDGKIFPGAFARIRLPIGQQKSAVLVPEVAVQYDQQGNYVLVVDDKNIAERRNVKIGPRKDHYYVIGEGLTGDERVVTDGVLKAIPGKPVNPEAAPAQGKTEKPAQGAPK